ncbi:EsaB/YukD family protein [Ruminiclostridium herbifermentans]|uniref:EsaB/YukD family protein n=1 Tax=Ruminiclostridium herbifermentans TaxID=2488810 RepID=A0A4U7JGQ4_9FIRM|nr:EsaB/YukD family protein [Ruminiclostridium herbifermentans]QNU67809.1 EsaB/YukD family protein [Ruminiclostridium herbifermentans]
MEYILVTFKTENMKEIDLKVPTFVKISEILSMLSESFNLFLNDRNRLQAEPLGRILDNGKTLQDEGVGAGALLTLI